ncbi:hypothetical protein HPB49_023747 [Dermacentor silvarum]|uniref:Uncharacterized protein n=1 Tax=Dermacentor silvarum TaxID=543639 RepID=A0ACB8DGX5_DERSI|nr:hypothetical protein HPB49_023747 [Dermacentor silvarum]
MKSTVGTSRLLLLAAAFAAVLLMTAPFAVEAAARQFCSPNGDVCLGPLDCCSGQCVNAVCCDEYLGTCPFDYYGPYWRRDRKVSIAAVPITPVPEEPSTSATELVTSVEKQEEASTPNTLLPIELASWSVGQTYPLRLASNNLS